ncbi:MAG: adenylate/guanylate cyclase domain-containing protein [Defluviicoccus sp.]|nr:adenylate/guanylate cyclase domain-containing protein [Defluviicoccus sp.]MDG4609973.1 adenylate/guanylate cyclase domain-containing protein [Defluviicoccus sp.]
MALNVVRRLLGRPGERQLPARIRAAIAEQERQAEILIGWLQLGLVAFVLALYTLSPKTSLGTPFRPVPYVLGAFLLVGIVRVMLSHRRLMPGGFLIVGVMIDMALLMGLIWSFHIQYMQPAPFYLKAPTLLYAFILIALRALRFDPIYVVAAGLSAATGWTVLVGYALMSAEPPPVTRDYVAYMTHNLVLIGAEVDKIIVILLVTCVLAVALVRARRMLRQAVADATVARDLTRFVAPEVADRVATSDAAIRPGDGEVKTASVLFCDIEGFSTISERLAPDVLMATLNAYFAKVAEVIEQNGGVINQFLGDAMMITFNTARPLADHAAAAVKTALAIQDLVQAERFGPDLQLKTRCGINTGELVSGAVGTDVRLIFTVYGDEVNIAARLEQLNKTYGTYVLATEQTLAAAGMEVRGRPIGEVTVRGRQTPVNVFALDAGAAQP